MRNFLLTLFTLALAPQTATAFKSTHIHSVNRNNDRFLDRSHVTLRRDRSSSSAIRLSGEDDSSSSSPVTSDSVDKRLSAASTPKTEILIDSEPTPEETTTKKAATSTVNERLLNELQASIDTQKYGSSKNREYFKEFRSQKSEEERQRSIEEARDLNGVNPLVCIGGAAFAWGCAGVLWVFTTYLGVVFASNPMTTDVYFVQRLTQVFRNVVMGLSSLASGFFGVVGIGIFLLGVRVAYGVMTGELDPTPIKRSKSEEIEMPDVWGLMMGKSNRRGRR